MKFLIIHADDFGRTAGINKAIIKAYSEGILTSTSILANTPSFKEAAKFAKGHPNLDIGVHLTIVGKGPLSHPEKVKSLLNKNGTFYQVWTQLLPALLTGKVNPKEVEVEFDAQISRIKDCGLMPTHLDSHQHVHMYPPIMRILIELAHRHKIPWIRLSREFFNIKLAMRSFINGRFWDVNIKRFILTHLANIQERHFSNNGILTPDYFYGMMANGYMTKKAFLTIIDSIKTGITEIMCHPGHICQELLQDFPNIPHKWEEELEALLDPEVKERLKLCRVKLTNYRKLYQENQHQTR